MAKSSHRIEVLPETSYDAKLSARPDFILEASKVRNLPIAQVLDKIACPDIFSGVQDKVKIFERAGVGYYASIIKKAGSDLHFVPPAFEDFAKVAANHQYRFSPYAHDKIGVLHYRGVEINEIKALDNDYLHAHSFAAWTKGQVRSVKAVLGVLETMNGRARNAFAAANFSQSCSIHDYTYSNIEPTFYLSEECEHDLQLFPKGYEFSDSQGRIDAERKIKRAEKGQVLFMNSSVHRAPKPHEISAENYGKIRIFPVISYFGTEKIEKDLRLKGLEF